MTIVDRIRMFARDHVRHRSDVNRPGHFPHDLWRSMGEQGLLALGVPRNFGGAEESLAVQARGADALAHEGRSLGLAVAWQSHNTLSRFFFAGFGSPDQRAQWLPALAEGRVTAAVAISEPKAGAHPKHLETRAVPDGDGFRLNGEKAYVTNGPIAGVYIVVAISAVDAGRKRFTAFLVPRETPGLTVTEGGLVDGLYPVGHCGLRLEDCRVGPEAVLGRPGTAYEDMAQPLRDHEDMLGLGTLTGGMRAGLDLIAEARPRPDEALTERVGVMAAEVAAVAELGRSVLTGTVAENPAVLLMAARRLAHTYRENLTAVRAALGPDAVPALDVLDRDLGILSGVARQVTRLRLRRLGQTILSAAPDRGSP